MKKKMSDMLTHISMVIANNRQCISQCLMICYLFANTDIPVNCFRIMCTTGGLGRYIGRLSVDYRSTIGRYMGRPSTVYRSSIGRLSVDSRPIVGRYFDRLSVDISVDMQRSTVVEVSAKYRSSIGQVSAKYRSGIGRVSVRLVKSAFEPTGPSGGSLSRFPQLEATRSISTPPWMVGQSIAGVAPALNMPVPIYTPG